MSCFQNFAVGAATKRLSRIAFRAVLLNYQIDSGPNILRTCLFRTRKKERKTMWSWVIKLDFEVCNQRKKENAERERTWAPCGRHWMFVLILMTEGCRWVEIHWQLNEGKTFYLQPYFLFLHKFFKNLTSWFLDYLIIWLNKFKLMKTLKVNGSIMTAQDHCRLFLPSSHRGLSWYLAGPSLR